MLMDLRSDHEFKIDPVKLLEALRDAFAGIADNTTEQPLQSVLAFPQGAGDCIIYSGLIWRQQLVGVKISPYISQLAKIEHDPVTAYTLLLSTVTGRPVLFCESRQLTTIRTAATTALALNYLVKRPVSKLAIIGSGRIAMKHIEYIGKSREWSSIVLHSPQLNDVTSERYRSVKQTLQDNTIEVTIAKTVATAVADADVVLACTSSSTPVIDINWLKEGSIITSVSSDGAHAHEVFPSQLARYDVFCDYRKTAPSIAGDMIIASQMYGWSATSIIADLPELITNSVEYFPTKKPILFRSTGLGIEDVTVAGILLDL